MRGILHKSRHNQGRSAGERVAQRCKHKTETDIEAIHGMSPHGRPHAVQPCLPQQETPEKRLAKQIFPRDPRPAFAGKQAGQGRLTDLTILGLAFVDEKRCPPFLDEDLSDRLRPGSSNITLPGILTKQIFGGVKRSLPWPFGHSNESSGQNNQCKAFWQAASHCVSSQVCRAATAGEGVRHELQLAGMKVLGIEFQDVLPIQGHH